MVHGPGTPVFVHGLWLLPLVGPDALHPHYRLVDAPCTEGARRWGVRVNVWTVDDPAEARRLLVLRGDALIVDDPRRLWHEVAGIGDSSKPHGNPLVRKSAPAAP